MRPHYYRKVGKTLPLCRKPKSKSHNRRGPSRNSKPSARFDLKKMVDDAEDCTLLWTLSRFIRNLVSYDLQGFEEKFPPDVIAKISQTFREALTVGEGNALPAEKKNSSARVRINFSRNAEYKSLTDLTTGSSR